MKNERPPISEDIADSHESTLYPHNRHIMSSLMPFLLEEDTKSFSTETYKRIIAIGDKEQKLQFDSNILIARFGYGIFISADSFLEFWKHLAPEKIDYDTFLIDIFSTLKDTNMEVPIIVPVLKRPNTLSNAFDIESQYRNELRTERKQIAS